MSILLRILSVGMQIPAAIKDSGHSDQNIPDGFFIVKKDFVGKYVNPRVNASLDDFVSIIGDIGKFVPAPVSASHSLLEPLGFSVGKFVPAPVSASHSLLGTLGFSVGKFVPAPVSASVSDIMSAEFSYKRYDSDMNEIIEVLEPMETRLWINNDDGVYASGETVEILFVDQVGRIAEKIKYTVPSPVFSEKTVTSNGPIVVSLIAGDEAYITEPKPVYNVSKPVLDVSSVRSCSSINVNIE